MAGEGGHLEQAKRICRRLAPDIQEEVDCLLMTDTTPSATAPFDRILSVHNLSPKERSPHWRDGYLYLIDIFRVLRGLRREYRVATVVVTGPGFTAIPAIYLRLLGARLIVFESWSRFEVRSKCSRLLYKFAHTFLIQHKELQELYPKAKWVGLL